MQQITSLVKKLNKKINSKGLKGKIVSISHLAQLKEEIKNRHTTPLLDEYFYQECLSVFNYSPPASLASPKSIIIVSVPQPKILVTFRWQKKKYILTIPPTYLHEAVDMVRNILEEVLNPEGYHIVRAALPLKIIAVRSGLAKYGRNNLTYINGMGSFHRLVGFYSDIPSIDDSWDKMKMMTTCQTCLACFENCPTGAITRDRFLIKAEYCLTFHNERNNYFPKWINPDWHHCIVGCLRCQSVCPANKNVLRYEETREHFSERETLMILNSTSEKDLSVSTLNKLERLSLMEYLEQLPRNLKAVLRNQ